MTNNDAVSKNPLPKFKRILTIMSNFPIEQLKIKFSQALENMSSLDLETITESWGKVNNYASIIRSALRHVNLNDESQLNRIQGLILIAEALKFIRSDGTCDDDVSDDEVMGDAFLKAAGEIDESSFYKYIFITEKHLQILHDKIPLQETKEHKHKELKDPNYKFAKKLMFYSEMGIFMKYSEEYANSNIKKLEDILKNIKKGVDEHVNQRPEMNDLNLETTFISLVAPSLTGKTQSAFTMQDIRCLYFFIENIEEASIQDIYMNYQCLSKTLCSVAESDMKDFSEKFGESIRAVYEKETELLSSLKSEKSGDSFVIELKSINQRLAGIYSEISANSLLKRKEYIEHKFFTLGFLKALIEDAESNYPSGDKNKYWMKYHAGPKNFRFEALTVKEFIDFLEPHSNKYYVFLDEFIGSPSAVLLCNLCRAGGIRCLVANTNSDITNLVGLLQSMGSGKDDISAWSIVMTLLNSISFETLEFAYDLNDSINKHFENLESKPELKSQPLNIVRTKGLENEILRIINNGESYGTDPKQLKQLIAYFKEPPKSKVILKPILNEKVSLAHFFIDLKFNQIPKLRPGFSSAIIDIIKSFDQNNCHSKVFIEKMILGIKYMAEKRKEKIYLTIQGRIGTLALNLSNAYDLEKIHHSVEHRKAFIMNHFFYLLNPVDFREPFFLTYAPADYGTKLRIHSTLTQSLSMSNKPWDYELTYFERNEMLLILACMSIGSPFSVAADLKNGQNESVVGNIDLGTSGNPLALKLDGNELEILATSSIVEASHHGHGDEKNFIDLNGQKGDNFIRNLISNIMNQKGDRWERTIEIDFKTNNLSSLEASLKNWTVPYLWVSNMQVPPILQLLTANGSINIGKCDRLKDGDKIDIMFDLKYEAPEVPEPPQSKRTRTRENSPQNKITRTRDNSQFLAIGDCKNYSKSVPVADLKKIIDKALGHKSCRLNLIFCTRIKGFQADTFKTFQEFCDEKNVNVFRFVKTGPNAFRTVQFNNRKDEKNVKSVNSGLICLIIETAIINDNGMVVAEDPEQIILAEDDIDPLAE